MTGFWNIECVEWFVTDYWRRIVPEYAHWTDDEVFERVDLMMTQLDPDHTNKISFEDFKLWFIHFMELMKLNMRETYLIDSPVFPLEQDSSVIEKEVTEKDANLDISSTEVCMLSSSLRVQEVSTMQWKTKRWLHKADANMIPSTVYTDTVTSSDQRKEGDSVSQEEVSDMKRREALKQWHKQRWLRAAHMRMISPDTNEMNDIAYNNFNAGNNEISAQESADLDQKISAMIPPLQNPVKRSLQPAYPQINSTLIFTDLDWESNNTTVDKVIKSNDEGMKESDVDIIIDSDDMSECVVHVKQNTQIAENVSNEIIKEFKSKDTSNISDDIEDSKVIIDIQSEEDVISSIMKSQYAIDENESLQLRSRISTLSSWWREMTGMNPMGQFPVHLWSDDMDEKVCGQIEDRKRSSGEDFSEGVSEGEEETQGTCYALFCESR
eukprot:CAMPEP_0182426162 /NCGR_PEP_ID=MMETSP1167-20130531/12647_1 /TAXON_ID=2988 /ORGANISM="Mallomonas Sp, Strain CCMP3275" /LENGTH=437 /DNA_ID=CAMNT_0024607407 /DNA_START=176 /DNA_END=1489 /DNA_ORIENTATION=+